MKWKDHPNLRKRPSAPSKGRGPVQPDAPHGWDRYPGLRFGTGSAGRGRIQLAVKRAFAAAGTTTLTTSDVFDYALARAVPRALWSQVTAANVSTLRGVLPPGWARLATRPA